MNAPLCMAPLCMRPCAFACMSPWLRVSQRVPAAASLVPCPHPQTRAPPPLSHHTLPRTPAPLQACMTSVGMEAEDQAVVMECVNGKEGPSRLFYSALETQKREVRQCMEPMHAANAVIVGHWWGREARAISLFGCRSKAVVSLLTCILLSASMRHQSALCNATLCLCSHAGQTQLHCPPGGPAAVHARRRPLVSLPGGLEGRGAMWLGAAGRLGVPLTARHTAIACRCRSMGPVSVTVADALMPHHSERGCHHPLCCRYDCPGGSTTEEFVASICAAYKTKTGSVAPGCP